MPFEVEQKFRVSDLDAVRRKLLELGATDEGAVRQSDSYFNHPVDDFAQTDEALRIRTVGERNFVTYKGPKLDATTKTRHESEVSLADGEAARRTAEEIFRRLRFRPVAVVAKRRQTLRLEHDKAIVEIALDRVDGVGDFVELEVSVDAAGAEAAAVTRAKRVLVDVAARLELADVERRSYLELLLAMHG